MSSSTSLTLTERLKKRNPTRLKSLNKIANHQTKGTTTESNKTKSNKKTRKKRKQRNHQDNNNNKVESIIDLTTTTTTTTPTKRRKSSRTNKIIEKFTYCNWFDDNFVNERINNNDNNNSNSTHQNDNNNNNNIKTWLDFIIAIGEKNKKQFPIQEQQKNDCTVMSAISAYEIQHRKKWGKDLSKIGAMKETIEKGAHLRDIIPRIWGSSNPYQPKDQGRLYRVDQLCKLIEQGPVYCGIEELGYPWANSASKTKDCRKEAFIPPRFDPYNNPWEPTRKSGADGHAIVIIGKFYCHDKFKDGVNRDKNKVIGNCFVTKCTCIPAGWGYRPMWSKKINGMMYTRREISYALLPIDLLIDPIRNGNSQRRQLNDIYSMKMNV